MKILQVLDKQQRQEVAELLLEKEKLRENAERLADKYEEINDRQQILLKHLHEILRLVNLRMPTALVAERNFGEQITKIHAATKELANNVAAGKKKMEKQQHFAGADKPAKAVTLMPKQETALKEILTESYVQIDAQIKEIKHIKKALNIEWTCQRTNIRQPKDDDKKKCTRKWINTNAKRKVQNVQIRFLLMLLSVRFVNCFV